MGLLFFLTHLVSGVGDDDAMHYSHCFRELPFKGQGLQLLATWEDRGTLPCPSRHLGLREEYPPSNPFIPTTRAQTPLPDSGDSFVPPPSFGHILDDYDAAEAMGALSEESPRLGSRAHREALARGKSGIPQEEEEREPEPEPEQEQEPEQEEGEEVPPSTGRPLRDSLRQAMFFVFRVEAPLEEVAFTLENHAGAGLFLYRGRPHVTPDSILPSNLLAYSDGGNTARALKVPLEEGLYTLEVSVDYFRDILHPLFSLTMDPHPLQQRDPISPARRHTLSPCATEVIDGDSPFLFPGHRISLTDRWDTRCPLFGRRGYLEKSFSFSLEEEATVRGFLRSRGEAHLRLSTRGYPQRTLFDSPSPGHPFFEGLLPEGHYTLEVSTEDIGIPDAFDLHLSVSGAYEDSPQNFLPFSPVPTSCRETIFPDGTTHRTSLEEGCPALSRPNRYAKYYSFTTDTPGVVAMASPPGGNMGVLLTLFEGGEGAALGPVLAQSSTHSLERWAPAGTYTLEVTSFVQGAQGGVALSVGRCRESMGIDGAFRRGVWTEACPPDDSGRFIRRYTLTLDGPESEQVMIVLAGEGEARGTLSLYPLSGEDASATFEDRFFSPDNPLILEEILPPGAYTLEVASPPGEVGGRFRLNISRLMKTLGYP